MSPADTLSAPELQRYSRHLTLPGVGLDGQERLKAARVLLVGAGGLGSPAALYLAAAGVGQLGVVDADTVDASNLQRQVLHGSEDVGRRKVDSAHARLASLNPFVRVERYAERLTAANAMAILRGYDVVVDGTDNFQTRYLTNDACVLLGIPNVYGSVLRFEGQASVSPTPSTSLIASVAWIVPTSPGSTPSTPPSSQPGTAPGGGGSRKRQR